MRLGINYETQFEEVKVLGKYALFTSLRINRDTVPKGMYAYDIRSSDDGFDAAQLSKHILVNHFGTVLVNKSFNLGKDGYIDLDDENDFFFTDTGCLNISQYRDLRRTQEQKVKQPQKMDRER